MTPSTRRPTSPPGSQHVTNVINAIMRGPDWNSTAIFLAWDDWGGFYDHVDPADGRRPGLRPAGPGIVISPYARRGYIDHQTLSFDAYLKFIEDDFLGGQRLTRRPTAAPTRARTCARTPAILGNLLDDFNFKQRPRQPVILNPDPNGVPLHTPGPTFSTQLAQSLALGAATAR